MRTVVETLLKAQYALLHQPASSPERQALLQQLREKVPAPLLAHYLRLIEQGRKGVGEVRNGVCSACHLRLPSGIAILLRNATDVHVCENCGCYLILPSEETARVEVKTTPTVTAVRKPRRAAAALSAAGR